MKNANAYIISLNLNYMYRGKQNGVNNNDNTNYQVTELLRND